MLFASEKLRSFIWWCLNPSVGLEIVDCNVMVGKANAGIMRAASYRTFYLNIELKISLYGDCLASTRRLSMLGRRGKKQITNGRDQKKRWLVTDYGLPCVTGTCFVCPASCVWPPFRESTWIGSFIDDGIPWCRWLILLLKRFFFFGSEPYDTP